MIMDDIAFCERRIEEEERMGSQAPSSEAALSHFQLAMLYKAQLASLRRVRAAVQF